MPKVQTLLFLTTDLPYPPQSGGTIKSWRLLEFLSKHYQVTLVCTKGGNAESIAELQTQAQLNAVHGFEIEKSRSAKTWLKSLFLSESLNAWRNQSIELRQTVKRAASQCDLVFADHLEVVPLVSKEHRRKLIYHSHNAEHLLWQEMATRADNGMKRFAIRLEAARVMKLEYSSILNAKLCFAAPNDAETIQQKFPQIKTPFATTYHLGNDVLLTLPAVDIEGNEQRVFYAGTLSWEPNRDGLLWFLREVWPSVHKALPSASFSVCGSGADQELEQLLDSTKGVQYLGFVPDLEEVMKKSRLAVVPLRFGSGMKIKTFDALYRGLPLVTTKIGAEGIALKDGVHAHIDSEAGGFAQHVTHLLSNPAEGKKMAENGRQLTGSKYTYDELLKSMHEALLKHFPES